MSAARQRRTFIAGIRISCSVSAGFGKGACHKMRPDNAASVTVVPEPSTTALMLAGIALVSLSTPSRKRTTWT